ncbi:MAG: hypothetical protein Q4C85_06225 [Actinomyces sp.]|uniref:hypothetical protein n=1 Tax=Actinomyces sp. TaxID=29317 RepID=UPI0026DB8CEE|nr:hypothetical protein [Actinomyces sp.]MDO4243347.1 hypothetical protein [Actinomyces sp.]
MSHILRSRAALAMAAALVLTACSSDTSSGAATASATAERDLFGTVTPIANNTSMEQAGLTMATMSIEAEHHAVVFDEEGVTYVEPRRSWGADLVVHRILWDGTEAWTATVPVEVDTTGLSLELSQDPGLGVVALWFSAPDPDTPGSTIILRPTSLMASGLTWFDLATGEQGAQDVRSEAIALQATASRSQGHLIGAMHTDAQGDSPGLTYLSSERTMVTVSWPELTPVAADPREVGQWAGSPLFTVNAADGTSSLHLGATEVVSGMTSNSPQTALGPDRIAVTDATRLWLVDRQGVSTELDAGGCSLDNTLAGAPRAGATEAYLGLSRVSLQDGTVECLEALAPSPSASIMGGFSDGSLLLHAAPEDGPEVAWLVPADRSEARPLGRFKQVRVLSDRIIDTTLTQAGTTVVNAFDYRDLLPQD